MITRCLNPRWQCLNPSMAEFQRWLPSSSWVRMNEWSFFCAKWAECKKAEFKIACHHQVDWEWMTLSQIELVWVRVLCKMAESKMVKSKIAEFKMPDIIKLEWEGMSLSQIELVWFRWWGVEMWVSCFCVQIRENQTRQVCLSIRRMAKMVSIQHGRIHDGCHHQVESEWMSLSQIELVWVRVRLEWECFEWIWEMITRCLNPRWQCLNPHGRISKWLPSSSWVRMNEWSFFMC